MSAPVREFLLPQITALVDAAVARGFAREVAVAVLIDIVTSPKFDTAAPDPRDDDPALPPWERDLDIPMIGGHNITQPHPTDARDEADFVKPNPWFHPT